MKQSDALKRFSALDQSGRYAFTAKDLYVVFGDSTERATQATLNRLTDAGILERPTKGVYLYALSRHKGIDTLEWIARMLRREHLNYVSLESALSDYGVISQIPVDRLTVMTTGRKGTYKTPYGTIEFTHTRRPIQDLLDAAIDRGRPLKVARKNVALRDLKRVGRNLHLIDEESLNDDD